MTKLKKSNYDGSNSDSIDRSYKGILYLGNLGGLTLAAQLE